MSINLIWYISYTFDRWFKQVDSKIVCLCFQDSHEAGQILHLSLKFLYI